MGKTVEMLKKEIERLQRFITDNKKDREEYLRHINACALGIVSMEEDIKDMEAAIKKLEA